MANEKQTAGKNPWYKRTWVTVLFVFLCGIAVGSAVRNSRSPEERIERAKRALQAAQEQTAQAEVERAEQAAREQAERQQAEQAAQEQTEQQRAEQAARAEEERQGIGQEQVLEQVNAQMVHVQGGSFTMGCTSEQKYCDDDEKPTHRVQVNDFEISKYEVTQELWEAVMGTNPSHFSGCAQCPVGRVSWNDIQAFLQKLNAGGGGYRLPSEAEWEYAARGGQESRRYQYSGSNNPEAVAWYTDNSGNRTHPVGQKQANELGLYDLSGNVAEWVQDCWNKDYNGAPSDGRAWESGKCSLRVLRGGSWYIVPIFLRSAIRLWLAPDIRLSHFGFRLARSLPQAAREQAAREQAEQQRAEQAVRVEEEQLPFLVGGHYYSKPNPNRPWSMGQTVQEQAAQEEAAKAEAERQRIRREQVLAKVKQQREQMLAQVNAQMVQVQGGRFRMGCEEGFFSSDSNCSPEEGPARRVEVGSFEISKYEVTQEVWEAVMGENPSYFRGCAQCPVERVSWDDIQVFLQRLNASGGQYRLPSEAEWEYAARGGQQSQGYEYAGSDDPDAVAWYGENGGFKTHPVGQKQSNELGLYDMSGNVEEWVQDCWNNSYAGAPSDGQAWEQGEFCSGRSWRVYRGGAYISSRRLASRDGNASDFRYKNLGLLGFRLARSLP